MRFFIFMDRKQERVRRSGGHHHTKITGKREYGAGRRSLLAALPFLCALWLLPAVASAAPRYYIVLREVEPPAGVSAQDPVVAQVRAVFAQELGKRAEVLTDAVGLPADGPALGAELKRRHLKGYQITVRIASIRREIHPPPAGKRYRLLERAVRLSLVGTTLPGEQLAVGGEGESSVQVEVGEQVGERQEQGVLSDALHDAVSQALDQALRKLDKGSKAPGPERRKK